MRDLETHILFGEHGGPRHHDLPRSGWDTIVRAVHRTTGVGYEVLLHLPGLTKCHQLQGKRIGRGNRVKLHVFGRTRAPRSHICHKDELDYTTYIIIYITR